MATAVEVAKGCADMGFGNRLASAIYLQIAQLPNE
jgi:hypothetical protein